MSIADFLDHTCDIYHVTDTADSPGFGLDSQKTWKYGETADISAVSCHFSVDDENVNSRQERPQMVSDIRTTLTLLPGVDIRVNDKIIDPTHNVEYTVVKPPRNIRNHHLKVRLIMREVQQDL